MKKVKHCFALFIITLLCMACTPGEINETTNDQNQDKTTDEETNENSNDSYDTTTEDTKSNEEKQNKFPVEISAYEVAEFIVQALHDQDIESIALLVHPTKGVRFSPYSYVNSEEDIVFMPNELLNAWNSTTVYIWGIFDGKGNPIEKTFIEYYDRFIYDEPYLYADEVVKNERLGPGSSLDNSSDIYPGATIIEYHFPGIDPDFAGMDWRSLRIVLEEEQGYWHLVGIIHDEWTI